MPMAILLHFDRGEMAELSVVFTVGGVEIIEIDR
jgi:hypothetical protein